MAEYRGDANAIVATEDGARLRAGFQKLAGDATMTGLWLESTEPGDGGRMRLVSTALTRTDGPRRELAAEGKVIPGEGSVSFSRAGLTEEYAVSVDGVRQDFVVSARPTGEGELRLELRLDGATAAAIPEGARLSLSESGRELAYTRLHVTDATGRALDASIEVRDAVRLEIRVDDRGAIYPVRIDPTFSDADWVSMGSLAGADDPVHAVAVDGSGNLYAGGQFIRIDGVEVNHIAKWDGNSWTALGSGVDNWVNALAVSGTDVYVGGEFTMAGGVAANRVAKWDGNTGTWSSVGQGIDGGGYALAVMGSNLFAGGFFNSSGFGATAVDNIARWDGNHWSPVGAGFDNGVFALAVSGANLFAGGFFAASGATPLGKIARWDGSSWNALGAGLDGPVYALATSGSDVYAGGWFSGNIAKWNGSAWSALGDGLNSDVYSLAVSGTNLHAGGIFTASGATSLSRIARWDMTGSTWNALGTGMDDQVRALAVSGSNLFVGGSFTTAGGVPANRIARWDGNSWSALGSGMNGDVTALAVSGDDLFAGGSFTSAGGDPADHVAKWDASSGTWNSLGPGTSGPVEALLAFGSDLYVGGTFTAAGGNPANRIAKWNGIAWSALGSGMNGPVKALAAGEMVVFAGGDFTRAGGKTSVYAARAEVPPEIEVSGNGMPILDGTTTPDEAPGTDFGAAVASEGATVVRSFLIFNDGLSDLTLGPVSIDGSHPVDFAVSQSPATTVPSGGSTLLEVTFDPSTLGLRTAILNIPSNDADEAVFDFAVQGTGLPSSNANLAALTLGDGSLTPAFDAATTGYTTSVANATASITVTPTVAEANATLAVRINEGSFAPATSGQASGALPLSVGSNPIEVRVTAQDTTTIKVYTVTVTRDKATQTITFANPGDQIATATVNLSATGGGSGNAVTFTVSDGPGSISGGNVLTFTGAGSVTITASQAGNSEYHDATPVARTFNVSLASQTLTFDPPGDRFLSEVLALSATGGGSGSGLVYEVVDGPGVIANGNELSFTGGGDVTVRVSQAGDDLHAAADPVERTFAVILPRPDVAVGRSPFPLIGSEVYAPVVQRADLVSSRARPVTGYLALANRVALPGDRGADAVILRGGRGNAFFRVDYFAPAGNATAAVLAGTFRTSAIDADDGHVLLRGRVVPNKRRLARKRGNRTVILRRTLNLVFTAGSVTDPAIADSAAMREQTR